jgi:hypothetical protein
LLKKGKFSEKQATREATSWRLAAQACQGQLANLRGLFAKYETSKLVQIIIFPGDQIQINGRKSFVAELIKCM